MQVFISLFQKNIKGLRVTLLRGGAATQKNIFVFSQGVVLFCHSSERALSKRVLRDSIGSDKPIHLCNAENAKLIDFAPTLYCMKLEKLRTIRILGTTICKVHSRFFLVNKLCLICKRRSAGFLATALKNKKSVSFLCDSKPVREEITIAKILFFFSKKCLTFESFGETSLTNNQ